MLTVNYVPGRLALKKPEKIAGCDGELLSRGGRRRGRGELICYLVPPFQVSQREKSLVRLSGWLGVQCKSAAVGCSVQRIL